jgi:CheY-like chemotaxis protein
MGGDLAVTSRPGRGSTFRLSVTVERVSTSAMPRSGTAAPSAPDAGSMPPLRILCVEDNPYGRVVLNTVLAELGHCVDFAGSGEAALAAIERDTFDLVLMDVTLSGMDGFEATRRIRALASARNATPVIGISARSTESDEAAARAAGMNAYLAKPVSPAALADMLDKARR